jgi:membrane-bound ClpP family serine protease
MAYSSTALFFLDVEASALWPIFKYFQPALLALIYLSIILNRRGRRTWIALMIITMGSAFIVAESYFDSYLLPTSISIAIIFIGCWFNGNFLFFANAFRRAIKWNGAS